MRKPSSIRLEHPRPTCENKIRTFFPYWFMNIRKFAPYFSENYNKLLVLRMDYVECNLNNSGRTAYKLCR